MRPQDVPAALVRAHATAVQPPRGPVFLSLPLDDWSKEAGPRPAPRQVARRVGPDPKALQAIAQALAEARNPALLAGADIDRAGAWDLAVRLAERTGATVFAPPASERAGFPEDYPQFAGALPFAIAPLAERLEGHDVVLVIGAPVFRYYPYVPGDYLPAGTRLFHVTDDPDEAARAPVGQAMVCDAGLAIEGLLERVPETGRAAPPPRKAPAVPKPSSPMTAEDLFAALARVKPADAVIVEESPSNLAMLHKYLPTRRPASFFTMASGGLGFGLPAAVGVAMGETVIHQGASLQLGALVACLFVGALMAPVARRLRMPFGACAFAAVVSLIPGVFMFEAIANLGAIVGLGARASPALVSGVLGDSATAAVVLLAMTTGLIVPKMILDWVDLRWNHRS